MNEAAPDVNVEAEVVEIHEDTPAPSPTSAVALREWSPSALAEMADDEFIRRLELAQKERERIEQIQKAIMRENTDYGVIPGTNKPTIYKPGAEILNKMARISPSFSVTSRYGDGGRSPHIHYRVACHLHEGGKDGPIICEGVGSANSWEKKYRYRTAGPGCPTCGMELRQSKQADEWYCWRKKGGCGATFPLDAHKGGTTENPDPFELDNTILKMAKKRAYNDATLTAHAASGIFTQDLEPQGGSGDPPSPEVSELRTPPETSGPRKITKAQRERLFTKVGVAAKRLNLPAEQIDEYARRFILNLGLASSKDLTKQPYETLCDKLDSLALTDLAPPAESSPPPNDDEMF